MTQSLLLLPAPRQLDMSGGSLDLVDGRLILLSAPHPPDVLLSVRRLQSALRRAGLHWEFVASAATPAEQLGCTLRIAPAEVRHAHGYRVTIDSAGISATAHDEPGLFYAVCTLVQIIARCGPSLPCLTINDWPDFPARGVMLDVSRDKVPTMDTLYSLIDMLASWKVNQVQLYTEHTFAYRAYPEAWALCSPLTGEEIVALDAYCRKRYVELVPNQNSFGHVEKWLIHPRFAALSEGVEPNMTLCPTDPKSLTFVASLFDELLPHFSSRLFNVGCDETQVGQGRSKAECEKKGAGHVYLDFLLGIYREVTLRGHTMMFWGDIIMHHPELIAELPRDVVALEWGYGAHHPFADHCERFAASGIPFYTCPGTSSWQSLAGLTDNALANTLSAAENGLKHGAIGYLNTDWGDLGHWQVLPVSFLPFAAGAAYSWCVASNRALDTAQAASIYAFGDDSGVMGKVAFDLGNVYHHLEHHLSSARHARYALYRLPQTRLSDIPRNYGGATEQGYRSISAAVDEAIAPLAGVCMDRPDAGLIKAEFANTARIMRHSCRRGVLALDPDPAKTLDLRRELDLDMLGIIQEYSRIWLARNRSGGLADSVMRFERARADYGWYPFGNYPC